MADRAPRRPAIRVWRADGVEEWHCAGCGQTLGVIYPDRLVIIHHKRKVSIRAPWSAMQQCDCGYVNFYDHSA